MPGSISSLPPKSPGQAFKRELYRHQVEAERLWHQSSCREAAQEDPPLVFGGSRDRWIQLEEELLTRQVGPLGLGWVGAEGSQGGLATCLPHLAAWLESPHSLWASLAAPSGGRPPAPGSVPEPIGLADGVAAEHRGAAPGPPPPHVGPAELRDRDGQAPGGPAPPFPGRGLLSDGQLVGLTPALGRCCRRTSCLTQ